MKRMIWPVMISLCAIVLGGVVLRWGSRVLETGMTGPGIDPGGLERASVTIDTVLGSGEVKVRFNFTKATVRLANLRFPKFDPSRLTKETCLAHRLLGRLRGLKETHVMMDYPANWPTDAGPMPVTFFQFQRRGGFYSGGGGGYLDMNAKWLREGLSPYVVEETRSTDEIHRQAEASAKERGLGVWSSEPWYPRKGLRPSGAKPGDVAAARDLFKAALETGAVNILDPAQISLARMNADVLMELELELDHSDPEVVEIMHSILVQARVRELLPELCAILEHGFGARDTQSSGLVVDRAAWLSIHALRSLGDPRAVPSIVQVLLRVRSDSTYGKATQALRDLLAALLPNEDPSVWADPLKLKDWWEANRQRYPGP